MIRTPQHCPSESLASLLDQTLPTADAQQVTEHVGSCRSCQSRLEQLAAEPSVWKETRLILSDPGLRQNNNFCRADRSNVHSGAIDQQRLQSLLPSLQPSSDAASLGTLDGYEVLSIIGFGGMGVVLRGLDTALGRPVAIKILHPHLATHGAARRRFAREARAAAAVNHPSVVPIHAVNADSEPPYLVMSFVTGGSLQDRIDHEGPLAISDVLRIGCQVADALAAAHAQGLVHRDVKPGNILLEHGQDRVMLSDFGLAQALDDASLTASGMIAGTPQYMSPEQARGETVDQRSDLFSLGGVLYAMTTGRPPFRGESTLAVLHKIGREVVRPACEVQPEVPEWFSRLIDRLLCKDVDQRPKSANDVSEMLRQCLAHLRSPSTVALPQTFAPVKPVKPSRFKVASRHFATTALVLIACVTGVVSLYLWRTSGNVLDNSSDVAPIESTQNKIFWNDGLDDDFRDLEQILDQLGP